MNGSRFKIPKSGYLYIIQRTDGRPFEGSKFEVILDNRKYDVVPSLKNQSISLLADVIVNLETMCLDKVEPGKDLQVIEALEDQLGLRLNELLLG